MAEEELHSLEAQLEEKTHEARLALLPKDPDDRKNALIEVRAGAGGDEAGLFGAQLVRMYSRYADRRGWKVELVEDGSNRDRRHQGEHAAHPGDERVPPAQV